MSVLNAREIIHYCLFCSLHQMQLKLLQHEVKLLIVDSMASLLTG